MDPSRTLAYDVSNGAGSRDIVVADGGYVDQEFVATRTKLQEVAVIAGCNPGWWPDCTKVIGSFGDLKISILADGIVIAEQEVGTNNNSAAVANWGGQIALKAGHHYTLRVSNLTSHPAGFYFRPDASRSSAIVSGAATTRQNGDASAALVATVLVSD